MTRHILAIANFLERPNVNAVLGTVTFAAMIILFIGARIQ